MARVVFVYFDLHTGYYPGFHHGLAYLFGALKNANHNIRLAHIINENDFALTNTLLKEEIPDLICLSFTTNQKRYVKDFLNNKPQLPQKLIIAGGAHCSLVKDMVLKEFPEIDGICIGEGEIPLKELCRRLDTNENYLSTPSFYFKNKDKIIKNPVSALKSIDDLALPDYSLFNYHKIISEGGNCFSMMLSRGCPYSCYYCCNHAFRENYPNREKYVRFPSIQQAINIIRHNLRLYPNTGKIIFSDDTFTLNKKWLFDFCKTYNKEINLPFLCNARVENIDEQLTDYLKSAGCISLDFGVESGNEWLRKDILNRNHSNKQIEEAFRIAKKHGIKRLSFNIIGLPFETKEMLKDTFNLNLRLRPDFGKCFYFYPYPGTKLYQLCAENDLLSNNLESVSSYFENPSLNEHFVRHNDLRRYFELMQIFFYTRLVFSHLRIPSWLESLLTQIAFLLKRPILIFLNPIKNNKPFRILRKIIRKFAMKYLR